MKQTSLILCLWAGSLLLSGCGAFAAQQGDTLDLTRTMWNLSSLTGKELVAGSSITAELTAAGKISGSSGSAGTARYEILRVA